MRWVAADLHIHTALSPCASEEMTPPAIVREAVMRGLRLIAICDHNSAENVVATQEAAGSEIAVLAGIEITTAEDVHVLGVFPGADAARAAGCEVRAALPGAAARGGGQFLLDSRGAVVGRESAMLAASSSLRLADATGLIRKHGGIAVASHVDRPAFGVIGQLGLWPADAGFDAIEISAAGVAAGRDRNFEYVGLPMVTSSDAHDLGGIGSAYTLLRMAEEDFEAFAGALQRELRRVCTHA